MSVPHTLWSVSFTSDPKWADVLSAAFDDALVLTVMATPRTGEARVEALYGEEPDAISFHARVAIVATLHKIETPKLLIKEMPKLDWLKKVASDFPPLPIARWTVHGALHRDKVPNRRYALEIDATSAFGTGEHPTTRGCLLMLDKILKLSRRGAAAAPSRSCGPSSLRSYAGSGDCVWRSPLAEPERVGEGKWHCAGGSMPSREFASQILPSRKSGRGSFILDMGCGSGILGMGYVKAMHGKAIAVDLDRDSVHIAGNNARCNGLRHHMRVGLSYGYLSPLVKKSAPYDLIMANIFAGPLSHMAKDLRRHLKPGGIAILSGMLTHQANAVIAAHRMQKIHLIKRLALGEWTILALRRRAGAQ